MSTRKDSVEIEQHGLLNIAARPETLLALGGVQLVASVSTLGLIALLGFLAFLAFLAFLVLLVREAGR